MIFVFDGNKVYKVSFSRYFDFHVFGESTYLKTCYVIIDITAH